MCTPVHGLNHIGRPCKSEFFRANFAAYETWVWSLPLGAGLVHLGLVGAQQRPLSSEQPEADGSKVTHALNITWLSAVEVGVAVRWVATLSGKLDNAECASVVAPVLRGLSTTYKYCPTDEIQLN